MEIKQKRFTFVTEKSATTLFVMINNADFWTSVAHIIKEGFTADGLQQLDRYAELFISEKLVYKRFSPLEQYGCAAGGTTHVIATLLAGAEVDADSFAPGISDFKRMCQRGKTQEMIVFEVNLQETGLRAAMLWPRASARTMVS